MALVWQPRSKTYLDTATGRALTQRELVVLRDDFADNTEDDLAALTGDLAAGRLTVAAWEVAFAALLAERQTAAFLFGVGGVAMVDAAAWLTLLGLIEGQVPFLDGFADDVRSGRQTDAQVAARARLYAGATVAARDSGMALAHGGLVLDHYPGDGRTECQSRCRCWLQIDETDDAWSVVWHTAEDESVCPGCVKLGDEWAPLIVPKG